MGLRWEDDDQPGSDPGLGIAALLAVAVLVFLAWRVIEAVMGGRLSW